MVGVLDRMMPERWKRIETLYHAASALSPDERGALLATACPDDDSLRREVEALLNEPMADDGFLAPRALAKAAAQLVSDLAPEANVGRTMGSYVLQRLLGVGGMGVVYAARDTKLERDVAIKILPHAFTTKPDRLVRFEREARMLAAVNHPNICAIHGLEETDGIRYLVLELVDGQTLADVVQRDVESGSGGGLDIPYALLIGRQIVDALEAAHERGIVHRDLKPANIKITSAGVVKVLDFGLAKVTDDAPPPAGGTRDGLILGTAAYMSPEQARGRWSTSADIWAFGCILYEMLTGRLAFRAKPIQTSSARFSSASPMVGPPCGNARAVRRLLLRCLAKDPRQRLRDVGDTGSRWTESTTCCLGCRTMSHRAAGSKVAAVDRSCHRGSRRRRRRDAAPRTVARQPARQRTILASDLGRRRVVCRDFARREMGGIPLRSSRSDGSLAEPAGHRANSESHRRDQPTSDHGRHRSQRRF